MQGQFGVRNAGGRGRFGKPRLRVEIAVRVDVDDERVASCIDPQVDPAIVAALEGLEGSQGDLDAARFESRGEHR